MAPRLTRDQRIAYLGCSAAIGVFSAFNNFTLTLWLATYTSSYFVLGLLGNTRSFEGAIVSPLAGAWSDKVWLGWLGRRRPFILAGGVLSAGLLALTPVLARFPVAVPWLPGAAEHLGTIVLTILLFTVTFNLMDDIHRALLADLTTSEERNELSGLAVVVEMVSQSGILVVGFLFWSDRVPDEAFAVTGALVALAVLVTVVGVREPEPVLWAGERQASPSPGRTTGRPSYWSALAAYRGAFALGLVMFFYWSGVNAVLPLVSVYVRDILRGSVGQAQLLPALMLLSTMVMAVPVGALGNRYGRRRVMTAGACTIGCAALSALVIETPAQGAVTFVVAGIGSAAVVVLTVPLLSELVPRQHMGMATGALAASGSIAAPLAAVAAGAVSDLYGPRAIFGLMAAMVAAALAILPFARPSAAEVSGATAPGGN